MNSNSELFATKNSKNSPKCAVSTPIAPQVRQMESLGSSFKIERD